MRSRLPHNRRHLVRVSLALGVFLLVGVFFRGTLFSYFSSIATWISNHSVSETSFVPREVLVARLHDLEQEVLRTRYQALLYQTLAEDHARLSELLAMPVAQTVATARVIARPPRTQYDALLVTFDEGQQVLVGDYAVFEGVLLGSVSDIANGVARITLFSSGGVTVDGRVGEPSGIVVLHGMGGGAFTFEVPQSVELAVGDVVVDGAEHVYVLAQVEGIVSEQDSTLKTVYAHTSVAFPDLDYVTLVRPAARDL